MTNDLTHHWRDSQQNRAFFGRRKGVALRDGQERLMQGALPTLRIPDGPINDLKPLFSQPVTKLWLEIGYGGAEHLLHAAKLYPETGFIGCEMFKNGIAKAVRGITEYPLTNVRLATDDAALLLDRLPDASLDQIDLFYPDPWPKRRHRKRRFISRERVDQIARVLKPQGLFRFASDIDDYVAWTLMHLQPRTDFIWTARSSHDWRTVEGAQWLDWVRTRYESKALREGRIPAYLTFERV